MTSIIQLYEIQEPFEAEKCIKLNIDHIGSVILSPHNYKVPSVYDTINLIRESPSKSCLIPLFSKYDDICRVLEYYQPDIIHFCDVPADVHHLWQNTHMTDVFKISCETMTKLQHTLKVRFPEVAVMRSIPIPISSPCGSTPALELAGIFEPCSDFFLTDTLILNHHPAPHQDPAIAKMQPVDGFVGITGKTCDWHVAQTLVQTTPCPVILAGGLSPANVCDGIQRTHPYGVDSCTGTNAVDSNGCPIRFKKDFLKIKQFIKEVKHAQSGL